MVVDFMSRMMDKKFIGLLFSVSVYRRIVNTAFAFVLRVIDK